jgi:hypothetical protein
MNLITFELSLVNSFEELQFWSIFIHLLLLFKHVQLCIINIEIWFKFFLKNNVTSLQKWFDPPPLGRI